MNKTMKKQYISPETLSLRLNLENVMTTPSITTVENNDLDHEINKGDPAEDGTGSDSRRRNIWEDEEEEDY